MSHINLLPWREKAKLKRKRDFGVALVASLVVALVVCLVVQRYFIFQQQAQESRNQVLVREMQGLDRQLAEIKTIREQKKSLQERIKLIQNLQVNRNVPTRLFNDIPQVTPAGVYLEKLHFANSVIDINGKSESNSRISRFMRQVEATKWLSVPNISSIVALSGGTIPLSSFALNFEVLDETNTPEKTSDKKKGKKAKKTKDGRTR